MTSPFLPSRTFAFEEELGPWDLISRRQFKALIPMTGSTTSISAGKRSARSRSRSLSCGSLMDAGVNNRNAPDQIRTGRESCRPIGRSLDSSEILATRFESRPSESSPNRDRDRGGQTPPVLGRP